MDPRKESFTKKYKEGEKIWSGPSFISYASDLRALLAELPVSAAAVPTKDYTRTLQGGMEYVYGEILYSLTGYEGYLRDKAFPISECLIKPIINNDKIILEFDIDYRTKKGEEMIRSAEVIRTGERSYLFFSDYYRPVQ